MAVSEEYSSYWMKIIMMTGAMFVFSMTAAVLASAIRVFYMMKLSKSLVRAASNMQCSGQILKQAILEPSVLAVIANARNSTDFSETVEVYEKAGKNPMKLCAKLFGMDDLTKDFVKYFDSKFLKSNKKSKKGKKKEKKSKK